MSKLVSVGTYKSEFNSILGINIESKEIYRSKGLPAHMLKSKHANCLKYIDYIPDIKDNVLIGIKLDKDKDYLYVSTMHDVQESKIKRRLHSGRLKKFIVDNNDNK